jgi:hypothetical protein
VTGLRVGREASGARRGDPRCPDTLLAARTGQDRAGIYTEITDKIIAELRAGRIPWVQPWGVDVRPCRKLRETGAVNAADRSLRPGPPR